MGLQSTNLRAFSNQSCLSLLRRCMSLTSTVCLGRCEYSNQARMWIVKQPDWDLLEEVVSTCKEINSGLFTLWTQSDLDPIIMLDPNALLRDVGGNQPSCCAMCSICALLCMTWSKTLFTWRCQVSFYQLIVAWYMAQVLGAITGRCKFFWSILNDVTYHRREQTLLSPPQKLHDLKPMKRWRKGKTHNILTDSDQNKQNKCVLTKRILRFGISIHLRCFAENPFLFGFLKNQWACSLPFFVNVMGDKGWNGMEWNHERLWPCTALLCNFFISQSLR